MTFSEEIRMQITFQAVDSLGKELEEEIDMLDHLAFSMDSQEGEDGIEWSMSSNWFVLGRLDGKLVSQIGILDRTIQAGGRDLTVAGVGGVATHPEFHRRGFAGVLLQAAAE